VVEGMLLVVEIDTCGRIVKPESIYGSPQAISFGGIEEASVLGPHTPFENWIQVGPFVSDASFFDDLFGQGE